jgi:multicomponent Na+:H+ antiporter subunit G
METVTEIITVTCLVGGAFFALTAGVGILRMPDFYSRAHPAGKSDTLAQTLVMIGLLFQALQYEDLGFGAAIKLVLISVFLFITAPTAVHAITRAAHVDGLQIWTKDKRGDE